MKPVKFLVIGDPHGSQKLLKLDTRGYDAAIVTGDFGKSDIMRGLAWGKKKASKAAVRDSYTEYVESAVPVLKHISERVPAFCVQGNAEVSDSDIRAFNKALKAKIPLFESELARMKNLIILNHAAAKFKGVTIAGIGHFLETRWVQEFSEGSIEKIILAAIEEEIARIFFANVGRVDIMVSHQPPYGILDRVTTKGAPKGWKGRHAGSVLLLEYIKKYHPRYVICGHIHEGKGVRKVGRTTVINAGCCGDWQEIFLKK
jgi:Icc-related predicted phosphoesterase